ncbi:hypothetical protein SUT007_15230 [Streptococcus parasuis]|nr:hypothetical protein SUT007_15230 [Streptococcus parasuis]
MNRYRYLLRNVGLLTLSSFATKILSFFLVPLYTSLLTTSEYGTYDLFNTTIGVLLPIITLNIQESVLRFSIDSKFSRKSIVTISTRYLLYSNLLVIAFLTINGLLGLSPLVNEYALFFFLMYLSQSLSGILTMYVRGIDNIKELSISSVLASALTIVLNVVFLAVFNWGLSGYFLANIIGIILQCIYLIYKVEVLNSIRLREKFEVEKAAMINYSRPLIANSIAWWVNNASDRYIVILFYGLAENGIYSVASKIPSILNIFQTIFNQAWTLSAVRDFDPEDRDNFFSNTYRVYNCLMVVICSVIIASDKILAKFLYANDFYVAWQYVPWLTIAILFGAISGYIGGFFAAVKDSKIFATSTVFGAITNIILNFCLVPYIGTLGAAIATAISYFEVWAFRYWHSQKYIKLKINLFRDCISYSILILQSLVLLFLKQENLLYTVEFGLLLIIVILYGNDILLLLTSKKRDRK